MSVGLTFSTKNSQRIKQCQRTWSDEESAVSNGLLVHLASPNQSDDEDNDAADAAEGLLGMAAIGGISTDMLDGNGVEGGVDEDDDEYGW